MLLLYEEHIPKKRLNFRLETFSYGRIVFRKFQNEVHLFFYDLEVYKDRM